MEDTPKRGGRARAGGAKARAEEPPPQPSSFAPGYAQECMTCPFGLALFLLRQTKPEVTEHLMKAGFELAMAAKAFLDSATQRWEGAQRLERIPVR